MAVYVKLLRADRTHFGFVYEEGLNELKGPFVDEPVCGPGGLYFCFAKDLHYWLTLYPNTELLVAPVTLCPDSRVVAMDKKLKTNRFILGPAVPLRTYMSDHANLFDPDTLRAWIWARPEYRTPALMRRMIEHDWRMLQLVPREDQTPELCRFAIEQDAGALMYVLDQTPELCTLALERSPTVLRHIRKPTVEQSTMAISRCGAALGLLVPHSRTPELCRLAVTQDGCAIAYVKDKDQTPELCRLAVQQTGHALRSIKNQTPDICLLAVQTTPEALADVRCQTLDICLAALLKDVRSIRYVREPTRELLCAYIATVQASPTTTSGVTP